jgi:hypothetical protein
MVQAIIFLLFLAMVYFFLNWENEKKTTQTLQSIREREKLSLEYTLKKNQKKEKFDSIINLERTPYSVINEEKLQKNQGFDLFGNYRDLFDYSTDITNYKQLISEQSTRIVEYDSRIPSIIIYYSKTEYIYFDVQKTDFKTKRTNGEIHINDITTISKNQLLEAYFEIRNGNNNKIIL